jgi:hypothetical protein
VKRTKKDFLSKPQYEQTKLKMGTTNSNGEIDFGTFETHDNDNYEYYIVNNNFIYKGESSLSKGSNNFRMYHKNSDTDLNLYLIPPPPYPTNDTFSISFQHAFVSDFNLIYTNLNYSTFHILYPIRSGKYFIKINKFKSGLFSQTFDTAYYQPNTINDYTVNW